MRQYSGFFPRGRAAKVGWVIWQVIGDLGEDAPNCIILCSLQAMLRPSGGGTGTKTRVPRFVGLVGHCWQGPRLLIWLHDGLGAARGQRSRKGPCASYPTHHQFSYLLSG